MMRAQFLAIVAAACSASAAVSTQLYLWNNVKIGGGGGFVPSIIFNTGRKNLAFLRTDIGGAYRLNSDDSWKPLLDFANDTTWNYWGTDALATDPVQPENLYIAVGMYTNDWDQRNGTILKSGDRGESFSFHPLPFKVGGNMPGRGLGERLVIDPNNNSVLYFGARSGNGLWKSTDAGITWKKVTSFPSVGSYVQTPGDTTGLGSDIMGIAWITFDTNTKTSTGSARIFVGVADMGKDNIFVSHDGGSTWSALAGQSNVFIPQHGVLSPNENVLYITYSDGIGPYDGGAGSVAKYFINNGTWQDITPAQAKADNAYGFGGLSIDAQKPGTLMVSALNEWYPDANIFRSTDGGQTWTNVFEFGYPPPDYTATYTPHFNRDLSNAPWISTFQSGDTKTVGWMIQGLSINPFDSSHWLYGTGLSLFGGRDLTNWDKSPRQNITIKSLANGIEETAVQGLTAPPSGPVLVSAIADIGGFVHTDLTSSPPTFTNPIWAGTATDVDHAGAKPANIVRLSGISGGGSPVATSTDGGKTWAAHAGAPTTAYGGKVSISANGDSIVWTNGNGVTGVQFSKNGGAFAASAGVPGSAVISSDKVTNGVFYAALESSFYVSTDGGATFAKTTSIGASKLPVEIAVNPFKGGEVFVSSDAGIFHSTDSGKTFAALKGPTQAWSIAVGAPSKAGGTPSLFAAAKINGVNNLYRSDNNGADWAIITTPSRGLSSASAMVLAADPKTYSQVYVGTNGRGIFVGHA